MLKNMFPFVLAAILVCGSTLFSADGNETKKPDVKSSVKTNVIKGAAVINIKGVSRSWKDTDKRLLHRRPKARRMVPVRNLANPRTIVKKEIQADPVVQTTQGSLTRGIKASGTPISSFDGMNLNENGSGWPPDTTGDVGETYFVQAVNTSLGIYRKSDGTLVSATTFNDFFTGAGITGTPCDNDNYGDPIVLYDQYNQRWFFLDFAWDPSETDGSYFSIAASKTSDPTGEWWLYAFRADDTLMNDYPKCGVWHDGIYITANMFNFATSELEGVKIWAIKTPDVYNGTITAQEVLDTSEEAWAILPANAKGPGPPMDAPNYMYAVDADEYGDGHSDTLYAWKYDVDWNDSKNTTWTGPYAMPTAPFGLTADGIPQQGTSSTLDSLYGRLMFPAMYRNFSTHESVYLCHLVEAGSVRTTRWYEIRIDGGTSSIYQQGTYSPDSHHRWMASIGADKNGSIALGYSISSSTLYPGVRFAARTADDILGRLEQGETVLVNGGGYQSSYFRWGDYSTMTIDPSDDETFWYTQEYYSTSGTNWNTRIASFKISDTGTTPPVDLNDAVDNADLAFTGGSDEDWTTDTSTSYHDGDAAKSGDITHNETSYFETTLNCTSAKRITFYWKVSSEANYDYLEFYLDGALQDRISGMKDWTQKSYALAAGSHKFRWSYEKDGSVDSRSDSGWVDLIQIQDDGGGSTNSLAEAVDADALTFKVSGRGDWDVDTSTFYHDNDSIVSPGITHNEEASVETVISGYTTVKFYWKVSSEKNYDYLKFYIDGTLQEQVSGMTDWTRKTYMVSSGSHTLKWTYAKDGSVSTGSDTGWVDKLELQ
jgi:hypothetical protein